jgi:hypothetical protein
MCGAAPSIGKGPPVQRRLSGHGGHGRTRCWPAPVAIDPNLTSTRVINTCRLIHEAPYLTLMYRAPIRQFTASIRSHVKVHRLLDALE